MFLVVPTYLALGFSSGSGEAGVGQSCDAIDICPDRTYDNIQVRATAHTPRARGTASFPDSKTNTFPLPIAPTMPARHALRRCTTDNRP